MSVIAKWLGIEDSAMWRKEVHSLPDSLNDVYLLPEYVDLYQHEGIAPKCFLFKSEGDVFLYPFLQQKTPYLEGYYDITTAYGYGGPVYTSSDPCFLSEALAAFDSQARTRNIIAELIKFNPMLANHSALESVYQGKIIPVCNTVYVDIDIDEELRWNKEYTAAGRKGIKKSQRENAQVDFLGTNNSWSRFCELYSATMRHNKAGDFYHFSQSYFQTIQEQLTENSLLASAIINETIGASMVLLYGQQYAYCHLIGTDPAYQRYGINNYLHHQCILWCKEHGIKRLLIGGGRTRSDEDSLLKFKKNFSKQLSMFHVGERILDKAVYDQLVDARNKMVDAPVDTNKLFQYRT